MAEIRYLALLRGINVGGKNIIKMADLKTCFEDTGLSDVATFIQSGNVVFRSAERDTAKLTASIEKALSERFGYPSRVVVVSHQQLKRIVDQAPKGFGEEPTAHRYDVVFLKAPLTPTQAMENVRAREGVDSASSGKHALYFSRLTSRVSQSYLSKIIAFPSYKNMTIRNWSTTMRLLELLESARRGRGNSECVKGKPR